MNAPAHTLRLTAAEVESVIRQGLPSAGRFSVEEVRPGYARVRLPHADWMLRPGNLVSGPALFTAADAAMYALVLAHLGPVVMAVTVNMNLNFLVAAPVGDVVAEAHLLRLGSRLAAIEVDLYTGPERTFVAHVTGSYALPRSGRPAASPPA
jgi:uncharacterized protein (TIGR00369 family)